jgi:hypothetical protein
MYLQINLPKLSSETKNQNTLIANEGERGAKKYD